jgi:DNA modification methylase
MSIYARQLELFELEPERRPRASDNGTASFSDPAFAGNKSLPIHRWVPWIAGFSRDFVRDAFDRYLKRPGTVLDPFSGVGTTLVEAVLSGHEAIGFEINPYAALACRVKVGAYKIDVDILHKEIARMRAFYEQRVFSGYLPKSVPPAGFRTRSAFYSPEVMRKVLLIQDFVTTVENGLVRDLMRLAFAATMVRYSNYSYEPSLGRRVSAGKDEILDFAVGRTVLARLGEMLEDIVWFQEQLAGSQPTACVVNDSFFRYRDSLDAMSVDLLVTSPPYLNNYHYNRNTRPQLYWLGYVHRPKDLKPLADSNFGKYWQTVRDRERLDLSFLLPTTDLAERLEDLRGRRKEKGVYGGNGWANYAAAYFNDCYRFAQGMDYVLKPGGTALVVIGNSILQGILIPTDLYLAKIAESVGLELVDIHVPRATRVGNSIIQSDVRVAKAKDSHQLYEAVVELRKR